MHQRPDVDLMGVSIKAWTEEQCIRQITNDWRAGKGGWIHTVNIDILRQLAENPKLAQLCKGVDYSVADGMPLVWASALKGEALPERITGSHLIQTLSAAAGADGKTVFMLGGQPGVAEKAGAVLMRQSPGLTIVGYCCPPFGFEQDPYEVQAIIEQVIEAKPDLLFLA
ncbi:MAG: WecB/TagA/CpsF family glycosyltransferase, partial [Chlamydiia bacterium]|nr:WecB/TagA/CpsF family glycosyltransferase [Chlamydiia bacterium]